PEHFHTERAAQTRQAAARRKGDLEHEPYANPERLRYTGVVYRGPDRGAEARALEHQGQRSREHDADGQQKHAVDIEIDPEHAELTGEIFWQLQGLLLGTEHEGRRRNEHERQADGE